MSDGIIKYALTGYDAGVAPSRMGTLVSLYDHLASVDAARAEIERLTARAEKAEAERDEATGTIERLNSNNLTLCAELAGWKQSARQMEAERDEALAAEAEYRRKNHALTNERDKARAQVAAAYEAAAKTCSLAATNYLGKGADTDLGSRSRAICDVALHIHALTPADAKAALEAYGRKKMREGMHLGADIALQYDTGEGAHDAILAAMEKEGGE